jgi:hypothetical protein
MQPFILNHISLTSAKQYVPTLPFAIRTTGQTRNIIFIIMIITRNYDAPCVIFCSHQRRRHKFFILLYVVRYSQALNYI